MEGHAKKWVEIYCELANKTTEQLYKVATPCLDDHHLKEEENRFVGEISTVCSQNVLKCLHLARIGGPDILWSVNKLARAVTKKEEGLCDKRFIAQVNLGNVVTWVTQHNNAEWDYFETWKTENQHQVDFCVFFGSQTFVPISWMCKKQTSVDNKSPKSHNETCIPNPQSCFGLVVCQN